SSAEPAAQQPESTADSGRSMKDKVLSTVENTLAPIVGVELGKTANGSGTAEGTTSMGPGAGQRPGTTTTPSGAGPGSEGAGEPPAYPSEEPGLRGVNQGVPQENVSPVDQGGGE